MHKIVVLVNKREDMSYDEFVEYWHEVHGPMAHDVPNLVRYTRSLPFDAEKSPYDGVAQLYFESKSDLKEYLTSETGKNLDDDMVNFASEYEVLLVEEDQPITQTE